MRGQVSGQKVVAAGTMTMNALSGGARYSEDDVSHTSLGIKLYNLGLEHVGHYPNETVTCLPVFQIPQVGHVFRTTQTDGNLNRRGWKSG